MKKNESIECMIFFPYTINGEKLFFKKDNVFEKSQQSDLNNTYFTVRVKMCTGAQIIAKKRAIAATKMVTRFCLRVRGW